MMINHRLELALVSYFQAEATAAEAGTPLHNQASKFVAGHLSSVQDKAERFVIEAEEPGGPLAEQGNYSIRVGINILTHAKDNTIAVHGARVEAINARMLRKNAATIIAALAAIDPVLGISCFWPQPRADGRVGDNFVTELPVLFSAHLTA